MGVCQQAQNSNSGRREAGTLLQTGEQVSPAPRCATALVIQQEGKGLAGDVLCG